jgi:hypothetical protein
LDGVVPQAQPAPNNTLTYPSLSSLAAAVRLVSTANAGPYPSSLNPDFSITTQVDLVAQTPDWGLSDEEEKVFNFPFNMSGYNGGKPVTLGGTTRPMYLATFGVAVSANLYKFKRNWSRAEIGLLLQDLGQGSWSNLRGDNGSPLPTTLGGPAIIDRGSGSGTNRSSRIRGVARR